MSETALSVVQGATYSMEVTYADPIVNVGDPVVPRSLTGYRAKMSVRTRKKVTAPEVFTLTSDAEGGLTLEPLDEMSSPRTGVVAVRISAQLTELLTRTAAFFDLFIINTTDPTDAQRLVAGTIAIDLSVTDVTVSA